MDQKNLVVNQPTSNNLHISQPSETKLGTLVKLQMLHQKM